VAVAAAKKRRSAEDARVAICARLQARREEIEAAALIRVDAIADSSAASDPTYVEGLRGAVNAAVDYGIATIKSGEGPELPIPVALLAQARIAARSGVSLDTVLRRYIAGYSLLGYFIIEEASKGGLMDGAELQRLLGTQAALFDRLLAAIGEEHSRESELRATSSSKRHAERIERLLEGELIDTTPIPYDFTGWHLGLIASGPGAAEGLRELAGALDLWPLIVERRKKDTAWVWLGGRGKPDAAMVQRLAEKKSEQGTVLSIGEPGSGLDGWRLTHRQAAAALSIAMRDPRPVVRYADVALLASASRDPDLVTALRQIYVVPLAEERDGGRRLRETLLSYFAAGQQVSATAAALGVSRQTVNARLRAAEERIGRSLDVCAADIEVAFGLERLSSRQVFGAD
jgi:hypothetical protein